MHLPRVSLPILGSLLIGSCSFTLGSDAATGTEVLPRTPPLEVEEALATFKARPGFHLELVASEPLVRDPIEIAFDEDGRLFVLEMIDYSELRDAQPHLGQVRMLEDVDDDGRFDHSTVYADNLPWPTALFCYDGGLFVAATPDVFYLKDQDDDGRADHRQIVFTGFAIDYAPYRTNQLNMQAMLNSFRWGLDNRIYGCTAPNGGEITFPLAPERPAVNVRGKDFAFDPRTLTLAAEAGGGQYGMSFDDRGRRFTCNNSDHIRLFMTEARYTARNPWFTLPRGLISIAADGPSAEVFRTSPDEPWRVLRTQWRVAGKVPGPIEGGGRASGYFTSATGLIVYRGDAWPSEHVGEVFIADCGSNLIHRKHLHPDGVALIAQRPDDEQGTEFLTSTDLWFRPVQLANAPDGTLYVIDMYREIIEHPWSLPPGIKEQLDLNSGNDRGRIYRIVPDGFRPRKRARLGSASTEELVKLLGHPNAWHRETAARLLYERQDQATATPALRQMAQQPTSALGRLHALYALAGQSGLGIGDLLRALSDPDDRVREHAVRLAEDFSQPSDSDRDTLTDRLVSLVADPSPLVRYQLAFTLGELKHPQRVAALAELARRDAADSWTRAAVLSSLADDSAEMFRLVVDWFRASAGSTEPTEGEYEFLRQLVEVIGAKNNSGEVQQVLAFVEQADSAVAFALVHALGEGLQRARAPLVSTQLEPLLTRAIPLARDRATPVSTRVRAIELLGLTQFATSKTCLLGLLRHDELQDVQSAALRTLGRFADPAVGEALVDVWPTLTPRLREQALPVMLARSDRVQTLLNAVEQGVIRRNDLSSVQIDLLMNHRDQQIRREAIRLLSGPPSPTHEQLFATFQPALQLVGDPAKGRVLFQERCISCHRLGDEGHVLGPDLTSVRNTGKEKMLVSILDPNRELLPQYSAFEIETTDEECLMGLVVDENAGAVTLLQAYGVETVVMRDQILTLRGLGTSIMPEGLEAQMTPQAMADLLEFIGTASPGTNP